MLKHIYVSVVYMIYRVHNIKGIMTANENESKLTAAEIADFTVYAKV